MRFPHGERSLGSMSREIVPRQSFDPRVDGRGSPLERSVGGRIRPVHAELPVEARIGQREALPEEKRVLGEQRLEGVE